MQQDNASLSPDIGTQISMRQRVRVIVSIAVCSSSLLAAVLILLLLPMSLPLRLGIVAALIVGDMLCVLILWVNTGKQIAQLEASRFSGNPSVRE